MERECVGDGVGDRCYSIATRCDQIALASVHKYICTTAASVSSRVLGGVYPRQLSTAIRR